MIPGDENKPMTLMERISDEPCDPEPYLDYAIEGIKGRMDYWKSKNEKWWDTDADPVVACVVGNLDWALHFMEELKLKMHRPTREQFLATEALEAKGEAR